MFFRQKMKLVFSVTVRLVCVCVFTIILLFENVCYAASSYVAFHLWFLHYSFRIS